MIRYRLISQQYVSNDRDTKNICVKDDMSSLIAEHLLRRYRNAIGKGVVLAAWIEQYEI